MDALLMTLLMLVSLFMMLIVLIQRGRGGGLAGAFGGAGGSSAFGTKAGDVFTKITIVLALVWFLLAGLSGITLRAKETRFTGGANAETKSDEDGDADSPPTKSAEDDEDLTDMGDLENAEDPAGAEEDNAPQLPPTPSDPEKSEAADAGDAEADGEPEKSEADPPAPKLPGPGEEKPDEKKSDDDN
ncbi:MAG: preprotein translocase subunit SecG [Planctomycetaceae bacterium]